MALVLAQAAPDPKRFACGEGSLATQLQHGTAVAVLLGGFRPSTPCRAALALRVKEEVRVCVSTRTLVLPFPLKLGGCWQGCNCHHRAPRSAGPAQVIVDLGPPPASCKGQKYHKPDETDRQGFWSLASYMTVSTPLLAAWEDPIYGGTLTLPWELTRAWAWRALQGATDSARGRSP